MRIGIDIDGVLTNIEEYVLDNITKYCVLNNVEYKIEKSYYEFEKTFNLSNYEEDNFWDFYIDDYAKNKIARNFASEVIKKLKNEGYEIYIITARWLTNENNAVGENMRKIVRNWLKENNIYYDKLIFSKGDHERKVNEINENKIDIMIEDNPFNIYELSEIIPVICFNCEYNKEVKGKNIIRAYSWYDVYKHIKLIKK